MKYEVNKTNLAKELAQPALHQNYSDAYYEWHCCNAFLKSIFLNSTQVPSLPQQTTSQTTNISLRITTHCFGS